MEITNHRETEKNYALTITVGGTEEQAAALAAQGVGDEIAFADGQISVSFSWPSEVPVDPESGEALMTKTAYAEMQAREAGLLVQSALDRAAPSGKGKKLATEGTTIEPG